MDYELQLLSSSMIHQGFLVSQIGRWRPQIPFINPPWLLHMVPFDVISSHDKHDGSKKKISFNRNFSAKCANLARCWVYQIQIPES